MLDLLIIGCSIIAPIIIFIGLRIVPKTEYYAWNRKPELDQVKKWEMSEWLKPYRKNPKSFMETSGR